MILPTKHLPTDRSLIAMGADIVGLLEKPKSVSKLWLEFQQLNDRRNNRLTFDWFTMAMALLFTLDAIEQRGNRICRREVSQ